MPKLSTNTAPAKNIPCKYCQGAGLVPTPSGKPLPPYPESPRVAIVGAGPAGLSTALVAAKRGHTVTIFDGASQIGGQLNMAKQVPGKEEFFVLLEYYRNEVSRLGINLELNKFVSSNDLSGYDEVVIATGVTPRNPQIEGQDGPNVVDYIDVLRDKATVGKRVAVIGAGGIGFDVSEFLVHEGESPTENLELWKR